MEKAGRRISERCDGNRNPIQMGSKTGKAGKEGEAKAEANHDQEAEAAEESGAKKREDQEDDIHAI